MTLKDMEMLDLVKCRIQFTSPEGKYEGTVHVVCPVSKKMIVSKIIFLPKRTPMGTLSFNFHEILNYTVLSKPDSSDLVSDKSRIATYTYAPARDMDTCLLDNYSEAGDHESHDDVDIDDLYEEEAYELKIPPLLSSRIPTDNITIDRINDEFLKAIEHIFQQDCIGVYLEGPKIGRNGILSWLAVSTSSYTFLFDIKSLGEAAFRDGLRKIFENPNIEKVFHDCRQASDCLFHQYNTRLVSVFDTQVADFYVMLQHSKDSKISKHVNHLDSCLRTYLEIPEKYIYRPRKFRSYEDEVVYSRLRPLQSDRRDVILKNVMYLRLLKRELNFALLTPFRRGVEVYLQVLQTASDRELLLEPSVPEELPQELVLEGIQVVRFKEFVNVPPIVASGPPYRKLNNPVKNYLNLCEESGNLKANSQSRVENECLSNMNDVCDNRNIIAMNDMLMSLQDRADFDAKSNIGGNSVAFRAKQPSPKNPANSTDKIMTKTILSPQKQNCDVESENLIKSRSSKIDNILHNPLKKYATLPRKQNYDVILENYIKSEGKKTSLANNIAKHPVKQSINDRQPFDTNAEFCLSANSQSQDSSDSEAEYIPPRKSYQDVLVEICESQKPRPTKELNFSGSSSDSVVSSDEDPWSALRAEFSGCDYSAETIKRIPRFVPE